MPQLPQFSGSLVVSMQILSHRVRVQSLVHTLFWQYFSVHLWPQVPQCEVLLARETQWPSHNVSQAGHTHRPSTQLPPSHAPQAVESDELLDEVHPCSARNPARTTGSHSIGARIVFDERSCAEARNAATASVGWGLVSPPVGESTPQRTTSGVSGGTLAQRPMAKKKGIGQSIDETNEAARPQRSPDGALVMVLSGASKGASVRVPAALGKALRVGKAPDNDLVVEDSTVSRHHLSVERVPDGIRIVDLGSRNGVRVGGSRVTEAVVDAGALIRLGEVELVVRFEPAANDVPPTQAERFGYAVGRSTAMRRIFAMMERIAATDARVLFLGDTGTGKDVLARSLHQQGPRSAAPFEVVDCGAIPRTLIESELFGHERGAFTGATSAYAGAFQRAGNGTVFLDEIGELPLDLQPKLLRVLEAREIRRVGGDRTLAANARVIAATTRRLDREVAAGRFREDLYYRLAVVTVKVPSLRERLEDIPLLVESFLAGHASDGRPLRVSPEDMDALCAYEWPGNARELRNVLDRGVAMARASGEERVRLVDFPPSVSPDEPNDVYTFRVGLTWHEARARVDAHFERKYLRWLLRRHGGNFSAAAREAQMDRKYLAELARRHGLAEPSSRS